MAIAILALPALAWPLFGYGQQAPLLPAAPVGSQAAIVDLISIQGTLFATSSTGEAGGIAWSNTSKEPVVTRISSPHADGLPGLDGLNASPDAFRNALEGLDPVLLEAVLEGVDPAVLAQVVRGLASPLPGLGIAATREQSTAGFLPGIDGLPVNLR